MTKFKVALLAASIAAGFGGVAQAAPLTNAGFESGLSGWTVGALSGAGSATVVSSFSTNYSPGNWYGTPVTTLPYEGSSFLAISSGNAGEWQTVTQTVTLGTGESIGGAARADWGDYYVAPGAFPDGVMVQIMSGDSIVATPFYFDGAIPCPTLCNPGEGLSGFETPWTPWSYTALEGGTYTVVYGARNTGDDGGPNQTYGYFDAAAPVPEPETYAMLLAGLGLLGFAARRRKQKLAAS